MIKIPEWFLDKSSVYPDSEFIAETGNGSSAKDAQSDAISRISYYFNTSVNASRATNYSYMNVKEDRESKSAEIRKIEENVFVSTGTNLSGVLYTEPFYYKAEKRWYCAAYIDRNKAWNQYQKELESAKNSFYSFYNKAKSEKDGIKSIILYGKAIEEGAVLMDRISYAQFLLREKTDSVYSDDMKILSSVKSEQASIMLENPVFISVTNDSGGKIYSALSQSFSELGFTVSKNKPQSSYDITADIRLNLSGDGKENPFTAEPSVSVSMEGKGVTVYSYSSSGKKITAWTIQKINENAFSSIANLISSELKDDFTSKINGEAL